MVSILLKMFVIFICLIQFNEINSYRILCTYPTISRSHFIVVEALMIGLAEKGHDVTVVSPFPPNREIKNYRHIATQTNHSKAGLMDKFSEKPGSLLNYAKLFPLMLDFAVDEIRNMLQHNEFKKVMDNEKFDLVIVEVYHGDPLFGLGAHFGCPIVRFSSFKFFNHYLEQMGNPRETAYVPNVLAEFDAPFDFVHRVVNMLLLLLERPSTIYKEIHSEQHYNEFFPQPKYPSFHEMVKTSPAVFISKHFTDGDVLPLVPGLIEVGGIHLKDAANPLPSDLQNWMDASTNGVIYFSFGSNVKCAHFDPAKYTNMVNTFKRLKENVLWKCETDELIGLPKNVKIMKWLPQTDLLQHKNLKLFVTHGGLGSVTEGRFYGVPLVVIPFFGDQMANAAHVQNEKWGRRLKYSELNEESLYDAVRDVIDDPKYKKQVEYLSMLYRDRPMSALDTGIFWIEYIIRHKGAPHMRSNAIHLNFIQLHSLDVIGFLLVLMAIVLYTDWKILQWIFIKICIKIKKTKVD